ncbi:MULTISPECIES: Nif11 family protein [Bradyrhizobium]|uniref:Nif11 family protein n=1 Tax=Bradyrhizobium TaxID=374 RepID=UPI000686128F|nr:MULTISPECIES: Nif11 family protein [Bradyrhizobium]
MSQAEVERFVKNLAKESSLLENLKQSATGLAPIAAIGKSHDYDFTLDEVRSCIRVPGRQELMQLDAIGGGKKDLSGALSRIVHTTALTSSAAEAPTSSCKTRKRAVT